MAIKIPRWEDGFIQQGTVKLKQIGEEDGALVVEFGIYLDDTRMAEGYTYLPTSFRGYVPPLIESEIRFKALKNAHANHASVCATNFTVDGTWISELLEQNKDDALRRLPYFTR